MVCQIHFLVIALSKINLVVVWRSFSKRWSSISTICLLSIIKCVTLVWSSILITLVAPHILLSVLIIVVLSASFSFSLLSIWWFPLRICSNSSGSLSKIVAFSIDIHLFFVHVIILWNAWLSELSWFPWLILIIWGSWLTCTHLITELSSQSKSSHNIIRIFNWFKFSCIFVLSLEFLIVGVLKIFIHSQYSIMCRINWLIAWNLSLNVLSIQLLRLTHAFSLSVCSFVTFLVFVLVAHLLHLTHVYEY